MKKLLCIMFALTMFTSAFPAYVDGAPAVNYPTKPITLVIPFSSGSGDIEARVFARSLEKYLGQPIVPTNMAGGSGAVGLEHTMRADPDGYTISFMSASIAFGMAHGNIKYRPEDLNVIGSFNAETMGLYVPYDSPFKTIEELVSYAKQNPGKILVGGNQVASAQHSVFIALCNDAGIEMQYVPYAGDAEKALALLSGNLDGGVFSPSMMREYLETKGVRLLIYGAKERDNEFKGVPIGKDLGYSTLDDLLQFRSYIATPGIPEEIMQILDEAFEKAFNDQEYQKYLAEIRITPFYQNRKDFSNFVTNFVQNAKTIFAQMDK